MLPSKYVFLLSACIRTFGTGSMVLPKEFSLSENKYDFLLICLIAALMTQLQTNCCHSTLVWLPSNYVRFPFKLPILENFSGIQGFFIKAGFFYRGRGLLPPRQRRRGASLRHRPDADQGTR